MALDARCGAASFWVQVLLFVVARGAPVRHADHAPEGLKHTWLHAPAATRPHGAAAPAPPATVSQRGLEEANVHGSSLAAVPHVRLANTVAKWDSSTVTASAPHVWNAGEAAASGSLALRSPSASAAAGSLLRAHRGNDGTACQCICGDRVVWHRLVFKGNVKAQKEHECEHEVCPHIIIPGLQVVSECTYVADLRELMAGTLCQCQCGDKAAWRNRAFYGNVTEERERYCLEDLCPRISPVPGLRFEARCVFDQQLFQEPRVHTTLRPPLAMPPVRSSRPRPPSPLLLSAAAAIAAAAGPWGRGA